jgi:hypothetical protein
MTSTKGCLLFPEHDARRAAPPGPRRMAFHVLCEACGTYEITDAARLSDPPGSWPLDLRTALSRFSRERTDARLQSEVPSLHELKDSPEFSAFRDQG